MKVMNMKSSSGRVVANQFIVTERVVKGGKTYYYETFQSYDSIIAIKEFTPQLPIYVTLDCTYWNYSKTTGKYRNQFLGESKKETEQKIKDGTYKLADLNK